MAIFNFRKLLMKILTTTICLHLTLKKIIIILNQVDHKGKEIEVEKCSCKNETPRTDLTAGDLDDILHSRMLNYSVIILCFPGLKSQYVYTNGLQDSLFEKGLKFSIITTSHFCKLFMI